MQPSLSRRWSRSATAGDESPTRRPSSARLRRASSWSSASSLRLVSSSGAASDESTDFPLIRRHCDRVYRRYRWTIGTVALRHSVRDASRGGCPRTAYFVVSAVFHYLGPVVRRAAVRARGRARRGLAAHRLGRADLRVLAPPVARLRRLDRGGRRLLLAWGCVLALMNCCFYLAIEPAAARDRGGDRVPAGRRARGARRAHAPQPRGARARGARRLPVTGVQIGARAARRRVRVRQRRAVRRLHRARRPRRQALASASSGIDGLAASMLIAAVVVTPLAGWAPLPALSDPVGARGGHRRGRVLVRDPVRDRSAGARAPGACDLRADGVVAAGDRRRSSASSCSRRFRAGGGRGGRTGDRGRGVAPQRSPRI